MMMMQGSSISGDTTMPPPAAATTAASQHPELVHASSVYPPQLHNMINQFSPSKKPPKKPKPSPAHKGIHSSDDEYAKSLSFLRKRADETPPLPSAPTDVSLITEGDGNLLTDYFYFIMMQLAVCRLTEKDRVTRGAKRQDISMGYGGLQCIHCAAAPSSRKFFWSNVDRLANSFAGIPDHVLTCKMCPEDVVDALLVLKGRHNVQMSELPRGSQKQFFRRMWKRLHEGDNAAASAVVEASSAAAASSSSFLKRSSTPITDNGPPPSLESDDVAESPLKEGAVARRRSSSSHENELLPVPPPSQGNRAALGNNGPRVHIPV